MGPGTRFRQNADLDCKAVDDGYVFYDLDGGQVIYLNLTAAAIFETCATPAEIPAILDMLRASGAPSIEASAVVACLEQLVDRGILRAMPS